jgi:hypothetical protein
VCARRVTIDGRCFSYKLVDGNTSHTRHQRHVDAPMLVYTSACEDIICLDKSCMLGLPSGSPFVALSLAQTEVEEDTRHSSFSGDERRYGGTNTQIFFSN